jgi:hypothetical protein
MLATMPCTAFPGRPPHGFESVVTDHMLTSTSEHIHRKLLRRRPSKRTPVSTFEGEGEVIGERWRGDWEVDIEIEIVVVVEWAVISVDGG